MKKLDRTRRRLFGFEPLEPRTMLAGDVTVSVEGGDLIVIGDDNPNKVSIRGTGIAGGYVFESQDNTNLFFNGQRQGGAFIVPNAFGNLIVDLNGGDDVLLINNVAVEALIINTDEGNDFVGLGPSLQAAGIFGNGNDNGEDNGNGGEEDSPPIDLEEVDNENLIDNDLPDNTIGHYELEVGAGGDSERGGFTAQGETLLFVNEDFIFQYFGYVDVGERFENTQLSDKSKITKLSNKTEFTNLGDQAEVTKLSDTYITQEPTLIDDDVVESRGYFFGDNCQIINWVATTSIDDGELRATTTVTFTVEESPYEPPDEQLESWGEDPNYEIPLEPTFGDLRFISFLDADIGSDPNDDILFTYGEPGSPDFKVFTVDAEQRVGLAHGGVYTEGPGLVNATWKGWTADESNDVQDAIEGDDASYDEDGVIDIGTEPGQLPEGSDPEVGTTYGPGNIETAFAWCIDPEATTATVTFFLDLVTGEADVPEEPEEPEEPEIETLEGSVGVSELLLIHTGGGNDVLAAVRVFGGAAWGINLGDEQQGTSNLNDNNSINDLIPGVPLNDQAFIFIASGGDIGVNAGAGNDLVNVNYLTSHGTLVVDGVSGNDVLSVNGSAFNDDVVLLGGSGQDTVAVDFSRHDGGRDALLILDSGADEDFILFARSLVVDGEVYIRSGGGSDRVVIGLYYADIFGNLTTGGNVARLLHIDTGSGNDSADIRANLVDDLFGLFGDGDDEVIVAFNHVRDDTTVLDGGGGFDTLTENGNIFGDEVQIDGFEELIDFLFDN